MRFMRLLVCAAVLAAAVSAAPLCTAVTGTWCEQGNGDAGGMLANAEFTVASGGPLNFIIGQLTQGVNGADMYAILIPDTTVFSASYSPLSNKNVVGDANVALYLFDSNGFGIEAEDDGSATLGGFSGAAGIYYLDVVPDGNDPEFRKGGNPFDIFNAFVSGSVSLPVVNAGALKLYSKNGCGSDCEGGYEIALAGAEAAETPEPPLAAITGGILIGLGIFGMKRRKRFKG